MLNRDYFLDLRQLLLDHAFNAAGEGHLPHRTPAAGAEELYLYHTLLNIDEINTAEAEFLLAKGFDLLDIQGLNLSTGIEFGQVTPDYWIEFALEINRPEADAIFLSCGGIRSLEVAAEIERLTGKPVITSNQAQFWSCLRRAGIDDRLDGFGQIFQHAGKNLQPTL